jgi:hypothetical protein
VTCCDGADSMLQFRLEREGDMMKHFRKMKRKQRTRLGSMGRKRDMVRRHGDIARWRRDIGEGKGRRRCQLD